jgi:polyphosphate kinase
VRKLSQDGLAPVDILERVNQDASTLMGQQQARWRDLKAELAGEGVQVVDEHDIDAQERGWLRERFLDMLFPVLTPLAIDPSHPFPFIPNLGFSLALKLRRRSDNRILYALVPVPTQVERFWQLPNIEEQRAVGGGRVRRLIPLESVLGVFLDHLFPGCDIEAKGVFRVIRDSDVELEEEAEDLVREFTALLKQRRLGEVVRVKIDASMAPELRAFIIEHLDADPHDVVVVNGMLGLAQLAQLIPGDRPELKFKPYEPRYPERVRTTAGTLSPPSARRTSSSTTRSRASTWWSSSCARRRETPMCSRSSRRSTAPPRTAPSWRR